MFAIETPVGTAPTTRAPQVPTQLGHLVPPAERHELLLQALDATHAQLGATTRRLLGLIAEVDRAEAWRGEGARDTAHWLSMRHGVSTWKAHRLIAAAYALEHLPRLEQALSTGLLGIDKVLELARFAAPSTESELIAWAREVSCASVRRRGDVAARVDERQVAEAQRARSLSWWWTDEGRRFGLEAELPADQGAIVVRTLQRMAEQVPAMPDEAGSAFVGARRADALVALCSAHLGAAPDPERATVVVHAPWAALQRAAAANYRPSGAATDVAITAVDRRGEVGSEVGSLEGCETDTGVPIDSRTVERLLCTARIESVFSEPGRGGGGERVLAIGRGSRRPPAWMLRQVRYRDRGCRFPGCGTRAFTEAHHVVWWSRGGSTELDNLLLICSFHHRLVHELGWTVRLEQGQTRWWRPDGTRYRAGPAP